MSCLSSMIAVMSNLLLCFNQCHVLHLHSIEWYNDMSLRLSVCLYVSSYQRCICGWLLWLELIEHIRSHQSRATLITPVLSLFAGLSFFIRTVSRDLCYVLCIARNLCSPIDTKPLLSNFFVSHLIGFVTHRFLCIAAFLFLFRRLRLCILFDCESREITSSSCVLQTWFMCLHLTRLFKRFVFFRSVKHNFRSSIPLMLRVKRFWNFKFSWAVALHAPHLPEGSFLLSALTESIIWSWSLLMSSASFQGPRQWRYLKNISSFWLAREHQKKTQIIQP